MKPTPLLRRFLAIAGSAALAAPFANAANYYWDSNNTTGGWGTAVGGIWAEPTASRWTTGTNSTTATDASRTILLADSVNFGDGSANTLTGGTITVSGTVDATGITFGSSAGQIILDTGIVNLAAAASITVNNATDTITSEISGAGTSLTKSGTGILVLTGANSYTGSTIINGGTINLGGGGTTGSLASTVLTLAGGAALNYTRSDSQTETFTTTNINGGGVSALSASAGNILNLGTVTRGNGGVLDFSSVGAGTVAALAASNDATGIMAGLHFGNSWAVANGAGVAISGLADGSYTLTSVATTTAASYTNGNIDVDDNSGAPAAGITANSLRFIQAEANTLTLTGANTITSGGILVGSGVNSNLSTITGGTLTGLANKDLSIIQNNTSGGLTISSSIVNTTSTSVTKSGAGTLTLAGNNTFTGGLAINAGKVALGNAGGLNSTAGSENAVTFGAGSTGILAMNGTSAIIRSLNTNAVAGTTYVENGNATPATLTIGNSANAVSSYYGVIRDGTGGGALTITKVGTGALNLGTSNTYSGGTNLNGATSFVLIPGMFGTGTITVNANTTMDTAYGAFAQYANALHVAGGATLTTTGSTQYFGQTFSGAVTGSGTITTGGSGNNSNSRNKLGLTSHLNTFTGTLANLGGSAVVNVNSLGDGGKLQLYTGTGGLQLGDGTATSLLFNTRQVELFGSSVLQNNNANAAITFTVNTALIYNGTGVRTLTLQGGNTGNNAFNGLIANNSGSAVSLTKAGSGTWTLGNTASSYTGATTISGGILEVTKLDLGGNNSSIGKSAATAGQLLLADGTTLRYTGSGDTTDRLFTQNSNANNSGVTLDASGTGAINFNNSGSMAYGTATNASKTRTLTLTGTNTNDNTFAAAIGDNSGANLAKVGIAKAGIGAWVLTGLNTATGTTSFSGGGTLVLDYTGADTSRLSSGALTVGASNLILKNGNYTQAVGGVTFGTNGGNLSITRNGGSSKISLGAIARVNNNGATLSIESDGLATTTASNSHGILSGAITIGSNYVKNDGAGNIVALSGISAGNYDAWASSGGNVLLTNYQLTGNGSSSAQSANSLRIVSDGASNQTLALGANTLQLGNVDAFGATGGLLYAGGGTNNYTISGSGVIRPSNGNQELIITVYTGTLTIEPQVGSVPTNAAGVVTKTGAGTLVLQAANGYTLGTYVNQGALRLANNTAAGTTAGGIFVQNMAALELSTDKLGANIAVGAETLNITGTGVSNGGALRNYSGSNSYAGAITVGNGGARINADLGTALTLSGGVVTSLFNNVTFGGAGNTTVQTGLISGAGGLTQDGAGTTTLTAVNTYTGTTNVNQGTLAVTGTGSINSSSSLTVSSGATFRYNSTTALTVASITNSGTIAGSGNLNGIILSGTGSVDPGNSPGILTASATNPSSGLDYNFEMTAGNTMPTWSNAAASVNDVLRLTGATPFTSNLGGTNVISVYFGSGITPTSGDVFTGGFFTDTDTDFLSAISSATFQYFVYNVSGGTSYNGSNYNIYSGSITVGTVSVASADFAGGTVDGYVTQFTVVVPEPGAALIGSLGLLALLRRRR